MAKVPEYYSIGNKENITPEELARIIEDIYSDLAVNLNKKPDIYQRSTDGQTTDTFLNVGDININTSTDKVEMLTNQPSSTTVTWITLS
jgi:hypothetical protein